ncbi:NHL repeat-containing protein [uncultured Desulfuromusa sp.]|uniref:NHL repeat-containing protein n=1 Tax=uncultured Desulfuromusa sp. TaxID=219183 RepID=UPI002AA822E2|nr:NHL repeat-containing protein [uncultured Desulfuromusa sp.]
MKRIVLVSLILGVFILPLHVSAASQIKLKYIGTIYTDAAGIALRHPAGVTISGKSLLIADSGGKRILSYSYQGGAVRPDKVIPLPDMFPLMVQQTENGDFYVLDGRARQIYLLGTSGNIKGKFTPKGMPDNKRMVPRSIRLLTDGSLLVLDIFSERVLIFDSSGNFQRQLPFPAPYGAFSDMTSDKQGTIYLLDSVKAIVYSAATGSTEFSPLTAGMKEKMNFPTSLVADNNGHLYLLDKYGSGLAILGIDGSFIGRKLSMGWKDSQLYYPSQISLNEKGDLFIADTENHRIQQFNISE